MTVGASGLAGASPASVTVTTMVWVVESGSVPLVAVISTSYRLSRPESRGFSWSGSSRNTRGTLSSAVGLSGVMVVEPSLKLNRRWSAPPVIAMRVTTSPVSVSLAVTRPMGVQPVVWFSGASKELADVNSGAPDGLTFILRPAVALAVTVTS